MWSRLGAVLAVVLLTLLPATAAQAHGGAAVTVHSDGRGSVWITAQWQDGHPISEPTRVTLTAVSAASPAAPSAAASVGPALLRQTGDERGTQTYSGTLDPGTWRVSIDLGAPVDGHCQAVVRAAGPEASPAPVEVACLIPATSTSTAAVLDAPPDPGGGSLTPLWITLGVLAVAGAVLAAVLSRRRARAGGAGEG